MSDDITHVQVRFVDRWREYRRGDIATFPIDIARSLHAQRVAEGLQGFAPQRPTAETQAPQQRQGPPTTVRK